MSRLRKDSFLEGLRTNAKPAYDYLQWIRRNREKKKGVPLKPSSSPIEFHMDETFCEKGVVRIADLKGVLRFTNATDKKQNWTPRQTWVTPLQRRLYDCEILGAFDWSYGAFDSYGMDVQWGDVWFKLLFQGHGEPGELAVDGHKNYAFMRKRNGREFVLDMRWSPKGWIFGGHRWPTDQEYEAGGRLISLVKPRRSWRRLRFPPLPGSDGPGF